MTQTQAPVRVPTTIVGAILALVVAGLMFVVEGTQGAGAFGVALAFVPWICAVGCWRGWVPMLPVTVLVGVAMVFAGLAMLSSANFFVRLASQSYGLIYLVVGCVVVGLVLAPKASRDWFFLRH